jgi:hypothetical protein
MPLRDYEELDEDDFYGQPTEDPRFLGVFPYVVLDDDDED